jgi:hypothetical protein
MDGARFIEVLGGLPLLHRPATVWEYGFGPDVLGLVIEGIRGEPLGCSRTRLQYIQTDFHKVKVRRRKIQIAVN